MKYLELDDLRHIATRAIEGEVLVRDLGLLESACARPRTSLFGTDAYPSIHQKAGALLHSIAKNHALVDGNKRLALAAVLGFYGINGYRLTLSNDEAYDRVMAISSGVIEDVSAIAHELATGTTERR